MNQDHDSLRTYCDSLKKRNAELTRPARILFIEDDPGTRFIFSKLVAHFNCVVDYAEDGITGENLACEGKYDLVFLDLHLPGKSGEEVFRTIHARDDVAHLPVVIFTGTFDDETAERIDRIGFAVHIRKPVNFNLPFMDSMLRTFRIHELSESASPDDSHTGLLCAAMTASAKPLVGPLAVSQEKQSPVQRFKNLFLKK